VERATPLRTLNGQPTIYTTGDLGFVSVLDHPSREDILQGRTTVAQNLVTLADKFDRPVLWVVETTAILAMVILSFLFTHVHDWRAFFAVGIVLAYFTVAAVTGGYLILLKNRIVVEHS
jgi:hypothetical protein